MTLRIPALLSAAAFGALAVAPVQAQQPASEWRTVEADNLLIIDTAHGRVLAELAPGAAPLHVARIRELTNQGFYDGLKFHRVIEDFMAQTGDPQGTGQGSSELPDVQGEFVFRRAPGGFFSVGPHPNGGQMGVVGVLPVHTQPDAQAMINADMKVPATGQFCPGVLGMARASSPNSANSQFFIMTGRRDQLNGAYTPFGRVVSGLAAVRALKAGAAAADGAVSDDPDVMTRVRIASSLPEAERPSVRVMDTRAPAFAALVEQTRTARGAQFNVCDIEIPAQVEG
ncbi:MAG TPA: peptidylprolyl isomerase [Brevundimonas sp.]|uniref:peptidylprolyl isomerase n=1 Tax=Brevundimonas sp. TaxID=1871086 RepID=UPI0026121513|nr:peptidylprolyl isomerase [Brevundimonas sp.]HRO31821.1 peptidylprolyl isomerase [Brevundimonas sp.]